MPDKSGSRRAPVCTSLKQSIFNALLAGKRKRRDRHRRSVQKRETGVQQLEHRVLLSGHQLVNCSAPGLDGQMMSDVHPVFAPDTPQEYVDSIDDARHGTAGESDGEVSSPFTLASRWSTTAIDGSGLTQGDPTTLTWSIVPDGTAIPALGGIAGESSDPSDIVAFLRGIYGVSDTDSDYTDAADAPWFSQFETTFDRWSDLTGITYVYEPNDDGAAFTSFSNSAPGVAGTRGDVRIGGHPIDGNSGVLAYNFFPNHGEMVIDTGDSFYSNLNNNSLRLRNVVAHEAGHGIGLRHVESNNAGFLMEPFISTSFDGPQLDDILGAQRHYGDAFEPNDTTGTATDLGSLAASQTLTIGGDATDTTVTATDTSLVSIDDDLDADFYSFTVSAAVDLQITLTPQGPTYNQGPQGGTQSAFDTAAQSNLALELRDTNGTSVLGSVDLNPAGQTESITVSLSGAGTYFVRVTGAENAAQFYQLDVAAAAGAPTEFDFGDAPLPFPTPGTQFAGDGALDTTFGTAGKQVTDYGGRYDRLNGMALQNDGKILAVGTGGTSNRFAISRYRTDGTLDPAFSGDGKLIVDVPGSAGTPAVAALDDGKILIAHPYLESGTSNFFFRVSRLNSDGSPDTTFGTAGSSDLAADAQPRVADLVVQPDGKIVIGGYDLVNSNWNWVVARFEADGAVDTSFGTAGMTITDFSRTEITNPIDFLNAITLQADGKIVAGGLTTTTSAMSSGNRIYAMARYLPDGSLDTTFDGDGKAVFSFMTGSTRTENISDVLVLDDGRIMATSQGGSDTAIMRLQADGSIDTTFGTGGRIIGATGSPYRNPSDIVQDSAGRFLTANADKFGVTRFLPDGTVDTTFGTGGTTSLIFTAGHTEQATSMLLQPDGGIVVGGYSSVPNQIGEWVLARLQGPVTGASHIIVPGFHLGADIDADADGQPNATATGDDNDGLDDEDGVVFTSSLVQGNTATITVTASAAGMLDAWLDFNDDDDWDDAGEQIFSSQTLAAGTNNLVFTVPATAVADSSSFARFRFSSAGGLSFDGPADDGEVEDYEVSISAINSLIVDTLVDESDGDFSPGDFSLREAIELANADPDADTILFAAGLAGGTITLTIDQLLVTEDLTITGPASAPLTVSGGNAFRVFDLQSAPDVTISGLTITNGQTTAAGQSGGGIRSTGNLTLNNTTVTNNTTTGEIADGGGIYQFGGTLTLNNTVVSDNSITGLNAFGGGIYSNTGDVIVNGSTIDGNNTASANGAGGGVITISGDLTITDSTVSNNENTGTGAVGGGVVVANGNLNITGSTISGNTTPGAAGGVGFDSNGNAVTATIINSTVSGNTTTAGFGGGVANFNGTLNLSHSTVTANTAPAGAGSGLAGYTDGSTIVADTVVFSSIIAGNTNSDVDNTGSGANTISSTGFNLIGTGNATSSFSQSTDQTGVTDALLGPLDSNGGPTQTHALLAGSPAIGAGNTSSTQTTDQRGTGFARVVGGNVDVGAFELQATNPSVSLAVDNANIPEAAGVATFTATLSQISGEDVTVNLSFSGTATHPDDYTRSGTQIVIPAGSTSGSVTVTAVIDGIIDAAETVIVDISGVINGTEDGNQQATTTIDDAGVASALTVNIVAGSISESAGSGATTATVSRNSDTTNALTVTLTSDDTSEVTVQTTIIIPAGQTTSPAFDINAVDDALVDGTKTATITATAAAHADGTDTVDVTDDDVQSLFVTVDLSSISENGGTATGTVTRNTEDNSQPLVVTLSSDDTSELTVPTSVTIPAGDASVTFPVTAVDDSIADGTQTVTITASAGTPGPAGLDTSFGANGLAALPDYRQNLDFTVLDVAVQPDGKIIVAGRHPSIDSSWNVIRLNPDGSYDTTWGTGGVATTAFTNGGSPDNIFPEGIDLYPDGQVIVVGRGVGSSDHVVARYDATGNLNLQLNASTAIFANDIVVDNSGDGGFFVGGGFAGDFAVRRYNYDGTVDTTYGTNGLASLAGTATETGYGITQQPDGRVVLVGIASGDFGLARFNTDGSADTGFSGDGFQVVDFGLSELAEGVRLQPDGKLVVVGSTNSRKDWAIARLNPDGSLDTTFSGDGKEVLDFFNATDEARDVAIQFDGKIVVAGGAGVIGEGYNMAFARYNSDGTPDTSFDGDGKLVLPPQPGTFEQVRAIAAHSDGNIIALGGYVSNFVAMRLNTGALSFQSGTTTIDVTDDETATLTLTIAAASISEAGGAGATTATVSRNSDTTNALTVTLTTDDTSEATVQTTVTIPAGQTTSAAFNIDAVDDAIVDGTQTVTVLATATGHTDGTDTLDVTDDDAPALTVSIDLSSISENGGTAMGTVTRNTPTTADLVVTLSSSDTTEATVPATVTIPAGQSSAMFTISGVDDAIVDGTQTVEITASTVSRVSDTFTDTFSASSINPFWTVFTGIPGSTVTQTGGVLRLESPTAPSGFLDTGLRSAATFGDADVVASVDFRIPQGGAMSWLNLAAGPQGAARQVYGIYHFPPENTYRVWIDNNTTQGSVSGRNEFGNESTSWHRLQIRYDADTTTAEAFVDGVSVNTATVGLNDGSVSLFMKDSSSLGSGPTVIEFDNFSYTADTAIADGSASLDVT
ncbi:MAG: choice-of-anchor Q domain-containing protein, partial [Fuerstiella sp.]